MLAIKGLENEEIHGLLRGDSERYLCTVSVLGNSKSTSSWSSFNTVQNESR